MSFKYIYGPVRSGRLGFSLGLDLLGGRICSFDCLYCEVGVTRAHTLKRRPYVRAEEIIAELEDWKSKAPAQPDYITLSGLGEPTLNSQMTLVVKGVRRLFPKVKAAILTNSSLMPDPAVRAELGVFDVVLPSLDTLVPEEFIRINRPCAGVDIGSIARGLLDFRSEFSGPIYLEVLLVAGINDTRKNLELLGQYCRELRPDRVDVVTMTRPGAYSEARAVDGPTLDMFRRELCASVGPVEVGHRHARTAEFSPGEVRDMVLGSLKRRPQTAEDLASGMALDMGSVESAVSGLAREGMIASRTLEGKQYYFADPGERK